MLLRTRISKLLPESLRRWLRPLVVPGLYRLERPRMERLYRQLVAPGDLVFDLGAAEGYHTATFLALGARVVSVEPQPRLAERLRSRFGHEPRVTVLARGVAERAGVLELHLSRGDPELATFAVELMRRGRYADRRWEERVPVPVVTLEDLIRDHGPPAFVKIDVEGYEARVLAGLEQPLAGLCFEYTREHEDQACECLRRLLELGRAHFNFSPYRRWALISQHWLEAEALAALLAASPDRWLSGDIFARSEGKKGEPSSRVDF